MHLVGLLSKQTNKQIGMLFLTCKEVMYPSLKGHCPHLRLWSQAEMKRVESVLNKYNLKCSLKCQRTGLEMKSIRACDPAGASML